MLGGYRGFAYFVGLPVLGCGFVERVFRLWSSLWYGRFVVAWLTDGKICIFPSNGNNINGIGLDDHQLYYVGLVVGVCMLVVVLSWLMSKSM